MNLNEIQNARWKLAEKIVQTDYEWDNIKVMRIMTAKNKNELNIMGIKEFLIDYDKSEEVLSLLIQINKEYSLPDFIVRDCANKIFFVEVKSMTGKVKLAQIDERESIKLLATAGYNCIIKNVKISNMSDVPDNEINKILEEYGSIMKGKTRGEALYYMGFLKEEQQSEPCVNVKIMDMIISLKDRFK